MGPVRPARDARRDGHARRCLGAVPALRHTVDDAAITALLGAVAPGGTLLLVHHDLDPTHAAEHGFDPAKHVMPGDVAAQLDDRWEVEVHETRPRLGPRPRDANHSHDVILRAHRLIRADDA